MQDWEQDVIEVGLKSSGKLQKLPSRLVWISLFAKTFLENRIKAPPPQTRRKITKVGKAETTCLPSHAPENQWDSVYGGSSHTSCQQ